MLSSCFAIMTFPQRWLCFRPRAIASVMCAFALFGSAIPQTASAVQRHPTTISMTIAENEREVRSCYEVALSQTGDASGKVSLIWNINDAGRAVDVEVDEDTSTLTDPALHDCMIGKLKSWNFPPARPGQLTRAGHLFNFPK